MENVECFLGVNWYVVNGDIYFWIFIGYLIILVGIGIRGGGVDMVMLSVVLVY